ncbi:MAG: 3-hydroxyacyl-ACP dehydratase FabZ [Acidobacteria bacterium]|nr:3-hydroxyacyl-ACP dehydratase FabZ [Acidobacteriota bacterium]
MMTIQEILKLLPHRYPLLLVDRVLEVEPGKRVKALKNVTANEPHFTGHFPGAPIMPGVLILESMAQCGALMFLQDLPDRDKKLFYFGGVDKARFRKPVVPGDQLILEVELIQRRSNSARVRGTAKVDGVLVAEAEILTVMGDRPE